MSDNLQIIPQGLVGLKDTPLNVTFLSDIDADDYIVQNSDQVIVSSINNDIILDSTLLTSGKSFFIKNTSGNPLLIDSGGALIDGANDITLNDGEAIQLVYFVFEEAVDTFYVLSYYIP